MLRCPQCGNTYTDRTLRFCLADGTALVDGAASQPSRDPETVRMQSPVRATETIEPRAGIPLFFKLMLGLLAFGLVIGSLAVVGGLIYFNKSAARQEAMSQTPAATPSTALTETSPNPDVDTDEVIKQIAEIQKMLSEGNKSSEWNGKAPSVPKVPDLGDVTARVNAPKDGFLALRVMPGIVTGEPLAKIPHQSVIKIGYCQQEDARVAGRSGHWCMTSYDGKAGWVFDAWLDMPGRAAKK